MSTDTLDQTSDGTGSRLRRQLLGQAVETSLKRLRLQSLIRRPFLLLVGVGALLATALAVHGLLSRAPTTGLYVQLAVWLWVMFLLTNFAEAMAQGPGGSRTEALHATREHTLARKLGDESSSVQDMVYATSLRKGDLILVRAGGIIPADGQVTEGSALVDESAITGESAPVLREAGGELSAVTGGTRVLSGQLTIRISSDPGEWRLDRTITLIEGARRHQTPSERILRALRMGVTLVFLLGVLTPLGLAAHSGLAAAGLIPAALLLCVVPATVSVLASAVEIAGMDRLLRHHVLVTRGRVIEALGDVDTLVLDRTATVPVDGGATGEVGPAPGASPPAAIEGERTFRVTHLEETLTDELGERLAELQRAGVRTVVIANNDDRSMRVGADEFVAAATPETRLRLVLQEQAQGHVVAVAGLETDPLALAQADVGVAMGIGPQAAKEAGSIVDLDSAPTKLVEIVEVGKQLAAARSRLAVFAAAGDLARYAAVIPAALASVYVPLGALNFLRLATPGSALLSAVILNPLTVVALTALALHGVRCRSVAVAPYPFASLVLHVVGGVAASLVGLKVIDLLLVATGLA